MFVSVTETSMSPPMDGSCPVSPMMMRGGWVLFVRLITVAWPLNCTLALLEEEAPDPAEPPAEPHEAVFPDAPVTTTGACFPGIPRPQPKSVDASRAPMAVTVAILTASLPLFMFICFAFHIDFDCSSSPASPSKEGRDTQSKLCQW